MILMIDKFINQHAIQMAGMEFGSVLLSQLKVSN